MSAERFGWANYRKATELAAPWFDRTGPTGWHPLDRPVPDVSRCCYLAVDPDGVLLYTGRVRRRHGGLRNRLGTHHARHEGWDGLWVVPLLPDTPDLGVDTTEKVLIEVFDPPENTNLRFRP